MSNLNVNKSEYNKLKSLDKVDWEVVEEFKQALDDLKKGNYKEC